MSSAMSNYMDKSGSYNPTRVTIGLKIWTRGLTVAMSRVQILTGMCWRDPKIPLSRYSRAFWKFIRTCFFFPPARRGLRGHPYKVLQGASHGRRRGLAFSVRVVKYWNKLPTYVVTAPSVNIFKNRLEKVWTEVFPHLPHWLNTHIPPPIPPAHHPLTDIISTCYPTPCSIYVVSSGPLWPTFHQKRQGSLGNVGSGKFVFTHFPCLFWY